MLTATKPPENLKTLRIPRLQTCSQFDWVIKNIIYKIIIKFRIFLETGSGKVLNSTESIFVVNVVFAGYFSRIQSVGAVREVSEVRNIKNICVI